MSWKRSNQLSYAPVAGRTLAVVAAATHLPLVDVAPLVDGRGDVEGVAREIDRACRDIGFFRITGHGVDPDLLGRIDAAARASSSTSRTTPSRRSRCRTRRTGVAWLVPRRRRADVGAARPQGGPVHRRRALADAPAGRRRGAAARAEPVPRRAGRPRPGGARLADATRAGRPRRCMRGIAIGLGLAPHWFEEHVTADPTVLFRIFHYPPRRRLGLGRRASTPTTACSRCSPRTTAAVCRSTPPTAGSTCPPSPTCSCATSATCSTD